jgi:taurine--2-oxoglutarate transaminase
MKRLKLNERATQMGAYLGQKLSALKPKHPSIGEVRGIGMFWAVELVKNQKTKMPFNTGEDKVAGKPMLVDKVAARAMSNGVYIQAWMSHFVIAPPLIISKEEIDRGVSVLDDALSLADSEVENSGGQDFAAQKKDTAVTAANK